MRRPEAAGRLTVAVFERQQALHRGERCCQTRGEGRETGLRDSNAGGGRELPDVEESLVLLHAVIKHEVADVVQRPMPGHGQTLKVIEKMLTPFTE
jgi:hypothetical protein